MNHYNVISISLEDMREILKENINEDDIIFTNKNKEIKLSTYSVEKAVELSEEIKKLSLQISEKMLSFYNYEGYIIKEEEFECFIEMVTQYHIAVVDRSYLLQRSGFNYHNEIKIKKSIYEVLASEYCLNHRKEIGKYAEENGIFIP